MARAIAKYIRMSPRKMRRVVNVIRGKSAQEAKVILKFMPYSAARVVEKVLNSAVANAKENENQNPEDLRIARAYVDQSVTLKRWRAMSRGRGYPILKRTSHVTIEVNPDLDLIHEKTTQVQKATKQVIKEPKTKEKHVHKHADTHDHEHMHKAEHKKLKETKKIKKEKSVRKDKKDKK